MGGVDRVYTTWTQEIECDIRLRDQTVPCILWEALVHSVDDQCEVAFERLDSSFSQVLTMHSCCHNLVLESSLFNGLDQFF